MATGMPAWLHAVYCGQDQEVDRLLSGWEDQAVKAGLDDWLTMHSGAFHGQLQVVERVLNGSYRCWGTKSSSLEDCVPDALNLAASKGHSEMVSLLLTKDSALAHSSHALGWTSLHSAACCGSSEVIEQLLQAVPGLIHSSEYWHGWTALHCAAMFGQIRVVTQLLLKNPACINQRDCKGHTALLHAVEKGHEEIAEMLLAKNPNLISVVDNEWNTALHAAVAGERCSKEFLVRLWGLHREALHEGNMCGQTPFGFAVHTNNICMAELWKWHFSLEDLVRASPHDYQRRWMPTMEALCEPLLPLLTRDILRGIVFDYLGFGPTTT